VKYDNYTFDQIRFKAALSKWLRIEKPDKTIDTLEKLLDDVASKQDSCSKDLFIKWAIETLKTFPQNMQDALWRTTNYKIQKYGKLPPQESTSFAAFNKKSETKKISLT
jgi:hypothetical protein